MTLFTDALLGIGPRGQVDLNLLENTVAELDARECRPDQILKRYKKSPPDADVNNLLDDIDRYERLFAFGVLAAVGEESFGGWMEEFRTFSTEAERRCKAAVLLRLISFLSFGELYTRQTSELEELLWQGDFLDPRFRHVYLLEVLARGPRMPSLLPWKHVRSHGRNYVELFGSEDLVRAIRQGKVAQLFRNGLLNVLRRLALAPEMAPGYPAFLNAFIQARRMEQQQLRQRESAQAWGQQRSHRV